MASKSGSSTSPPASRCPTGRKGRIALKGWSLFQGYHKDSGDHLDEDGYLHSDDIGTLDASGRLFLGDVAFVS